MSGCPLVRAVKQLAHGYRSGTLGAYLTEPVVVLGRERVLQEIELELLAILDELDRLARLVALVHVVHEFDFEAKLFTAGGEDIEHAAQRGTALEHRTFMQAARGSCPAACSSTTASGSPQPFRRGHRRHGRRRSHERVGNHAP